MHVCRNGVDTLLVKQDVNQSDVRISITVVKYMWKQLIYIIDNQPHEG